MFCVRVKWPLPPGDNPIAVNYYYYYYYYYYYVKWQLPPGVYPFAVNKYYYYVNWLLPPGVYAFAVNKYYYVELLNETRQLRLCVVSSATTNKARWITISLYFWYKKTVLLLKKLWCVSKRWSCVVLLHTAFSLCSISCTRAPAAVSSNYDSQFCVSYICIWVPCSYSLQIV
jgi:hypothetical protein